MMMMVFLRVSDYIKCGIGMIKVWEVWEARGKQATQSHRASVPHLQAKDYRNYPAGLLS